jgi:hypothetical protein
MYRKQDYNVFRTDVMPLDWYTHLYHVQFGNIGFINETMSAYRRHPEGVWWDTYKNLDDVWEKHGLSHLNLYSEMLKLYGDNAADNRIIFNHIYKAFEQLIRLYGKNGSQVLQEAIMKFPEYGSHVMRNQQKEIIDNKLELEHMARELQTRIHQYDAQKTELIAIKNSKSWKTAQKLTKARSVLPRKKS